MRWRVKLEAQKTAIQTIALARTRPKAVDPDIAGLVDENDLAALGGMALLIVAKIGEKYCPWGTGVLLAPGIILTAKHVYREFQSAARQNSPDGILALAPDGKNLKAWATKQVYSLGNSDLSILLAEPRWNVDIREEVFSIPDIVVRTPKIGEKILVFGFRSETENVMMSRSIAEISVSAFSTLGIVTAAYPSGRDRVILPGPCIEVDAASIGGMSGGPAFDEEGNLIGILSTSMTLADGRPSFISLLAPAVNRRISPHWPMNYWKRDRKLLDYLDSCDLRIFVRLGPEVIFDGTNLYSRS